jgi:hypothetical protein
MTSPASSEYGGFFISDFEIVKVERGRNAEKMPPLSHAKKHKNLTESVTFDSRQSSRMMVTKQEPLGPRIEVERALAVWWLIHGAGLSNVEAGKALHLSPNAVSKILRKLRDDPNGYGSGVIFDWMQKLKGQ